MARKMMGLDWAAGGLKIAAPGAGGTLTARLPWRNDGAVPPAVGDADPAPLREFVRQHRLKGRVARVAVQRRDVLMLSCRPDDDPAAMESVLPPPLAGWRWSSFSFEGDASVVVAIEECPARALEKFVETAGLRFGSVVLVLDPQGNGVVTLDVGLTEARIAWRGSGGTLQLQRRRRDVEDVIAALGSTPVSTLHLMGGGSMDKSFSATLKDRLGCEVVLPFSVNDALYRVAEMAATGSGMELWNAGRSAPRRAGTGARAAAALALSLALGSSAALGWAEHFLTNRARPVTPADARTSIPHLPSSAVFGRALNAIPAAVTLTDLDLDAAAHVLTIDGVAASHDAVAMLVGQLSTASFTRPRCVKAASNESRRVRFTVVAGYDR